MRSCALVRARRITCDAWQPESLRAFGTPPTRRRPPLDPTPIATAVHAARWIVKHFTCVMLIVLVVASGVNLPLVAAASAASAAAPSTGGATSSSNGSSPSASDTLQPHVLLVSLPWRGHVFPLRALGSRLVERGFHVSFAVPSEEARGWLSGTGIEVVPGGGAKSCARVRRHRERQASFAHMTVGFNVSHQARAHPGAQLVDLFSAPDFAFQVDTLKGDVGNSSANPSSAPSSSSGDTSPNGVSLLMRTYAEFQACMYPTLAASVAELLEPRTYEARFRAAQETHHRARTQWRESEREKFSSLSKKERESRERELANQEAVLFPPVLQVGPPRLAIIDRFTFAGIDAAKQFDIPYIINNPHVLLDLDSPSWSLPTPWSYLPPVPPLSLSSRVRNFAHRLDYRATMMRAFREVDSNRARADLTHIESWSDYFASTIILTNTVWGVELHRTDDAIGMHAHRNANPHVNAHSPRFKMTGPLLPVPNAAADDSTAGTVHTDAMQAMRPSLPRYTVDWSKKLLRFVSRSSQEGKRLIYVNLGDGDDLTAEDTRAILTGLAAHSRSFDVVWSLPPRHAVSLLGPSSARPAFLLHVAFVPQFEFLATFADRIALVLTHATLANVQECLAAATPILLLPHPYVDQIEIASRFARTGAVYVLQRVQLDEHNVQMSVEKMSTDHSYHATARLLSPLFLPSSSTGTIDAVSLVEVSYHVGWRHLMPLASRADLSLPFYRGTFYGLPIDVYAILTVTIAVVVYACKQVWHAAASVWVGDKKWQ